MYNPVVRPIKTKKKKKGESTNYNVSNLRRAITIDSALKDNKRL